MHVQIIVHKRYLLYALFTHQTLHKWISICNHFNFRVMLERTSISAIINTFLNQNYNIILSHDSKFAYIQSLFPDTSFIPIFPTFFLFFIYIFSYSLPSTLMATYKSFLHKNFFPKYKILESRLTYTHGFHTNKTTDIHCQFTRNNELDITKKCNVWFMQTVLLLPLWNTFDFY